MTLDNIATNTAMEILKNLERWEAEAGQQAQIEQDSEAYTDTMVDFIRGPILEALLKASTREPLS